MKPCPQNKERIVWLESGVLDTPEVQPLREHLAACAGCRAYWREIADLTGQLGKQESASVAMDCDLEHFHQKLARRISQDARQHSPAQGAERVPHWLFVGWRPALVTALATIALAAFFMNPTPHNRPGPANQATLPKAVKLPSAIPRPNTLGAYRIAANNSLDALDQLLTEHAARAGGPVESLTVASVVRMNGEH